MPSDIHSNSNGKLSTSYIYRWGHHLHLLSRELIGISTSFSFPTTPHHL
jgi:hypothetical protein